MAKRTVSIYDIAKLAQVSTATVSNVLNGKGSYSEATRVRVLEIAKREGYVANFAARSLRSTRTKTVAILTPDVSNDFFSTLVLAVEGRLRAAGYTSYICNTASDPEREAGYVYDLISRQVDGLVYIGGTTREPVGGGASVPVAHIDHVGSIGLGREVFVGNDSHQMIYDMTQTLLAHGCRRVALASVSATLYRSGGDYTSGYEACLADHGFAADPALVLAGPHLQASLVEGGTLVADYLDAGGDLDGVVALGDRVALGVVNALKARGVAVGQDVLVIGMDDSIYSRASTPAISTVDRHTTEMAERGVASLLALMDASAQGDPGQDASTPAANQTIPHGIIERATTLGA